MARRYIDADALIEKLKEQKDCRGALFIPFLTLVEIQATADVVPKSEVDKWFRECEELQGRLIELKKEVAREIFEEIERETKNHGICYTQRKIAELKKKHIGDKQRKEDKGK